MTKSEIETAFGVPIHEGSVFRLHLGEEEGVKDKNLGDNGRNKYFVVLGISEEDLLCGVVLINTTICKGLPVHIKECHIPISARTYDFLEGIDRYVDCSSIKEISFKKFKDSFVHCYKGMITREDLDRITNVVVGYDNAIPKQLKKFSLI